MGRRRFLLWVAFLAILVVTCGLPCWGWDSVSPMGASFGAATVGYAPSQDLNLSFFGGKAGVAVGYILATGQGSNGASPGVDLTEAGAGGASSGVEAQVSYGTEGPMGTDIKLTGGFTGVNIGGSNATYTGPTLIGGPVNGDNVNAKLDLRLWSATADFGWPSTTGGAGYTVGPRIQWVQYVDTFSFTDNTLATSSSHSRSLAMFGIGGRVALALPSLAFSTRYGSLTPRLTATGTIGFGGSMRYAWVECFLQFFDNTFAGTNLKGEVGYMWLQFREHSDVITAGATVPRNATYSLSVPSIKGSLAF